ncbi:hypothetical protein CCR75_001044 [Bremia lactucae]|uniref:sn-1-specific diacylglycerol lipase n=1 Tax=Bremia lactucae TaxID=4779 RepID=A0A976IGX9_BRELC|nr:hypothetical protein CCR75_001043 [Bremia lactucae]TDH71597.1 hypothetical protein CCR75_001044 [Bremia lactucae]
MTAPDTLRPMDTIEGPRAKACLFQPPSLKRIVLNPRAYLTPFVLFILFHDLPLFLAFGLIDKPDVGYETCDRLQDLFLWLRIAFILHLLLAAMMLACVLYTLSTRVYHERRPEGWLILSIFMGYWTNFGWALYGELVMRSDTSICGDVNWAQIQARADSINYFQHFDFVFTLVIVLLGACSSYMCGVHSGDDAVEAEKRWQKRCLCCFHALTCHHTVEHDGESDVFETLGRVLSKFFVVRYQTNRYEGLSFTDLKFSLDLVAHAQKHERDAARVHSMVAPRHFACDIEAQRLNDLAFYARMAIGIYGWPIYIWYTPCRFFRVFGCFRPLQPDQVFEHDNFVHGNRASFIHYTGVHDADLVYLNCYNFVFQAPYGIVKDQARKELILCVRGSMSFYDFVTDGMAQIVRMDPDELPDDVPYAFDTRTHDGMLRTARQIFTHLQEGTRKTVFWDFALRHCALANHTECQDKAARAWKVVVCGHSMGAGVGCLLAILLRKVLVDTRAFLYAVPPLLDPETAAWTKTFATTAVYGDDLVPRLSIANMARLRDEMAMQYDAVANEPLFQVKYGRKKHLLDLSNDTGVHASPVEPLVRLPTVLETTNSMLLEETRAISGRTTSARTMSPRGFGTSGTLAASRLSRDLSNVTMITLPQEDSSQEVDVPGEIVHIQTLTTARRCGCTVFMGEQKLQYTLQDASFFRRIWVTPRSLQDHMVHHYDRKIRHLVTHCMDVEAVDRKSASSRLSWVDDTEGLDRKDKTSTFVTEYQDLEDVV